MNNKGSTMPLFWAVGIIFILGILIPFIISGFVSVGDIEEPEIVTSTVDFINNGVNVTFFNFTFFGFFEVSPSGNFDLFFFVPTVIKTYITDTLVYFSVIPLWILLPLLAFIIICLVISGISLFTGAG